MNRKAVFGVLAFLLVLQAQTVFAADGAYQFFEEIKSGNLSKAERILKNNVRRWDTNEQSKAWSFILDDDVSSARSLEAVKLLQKYNVNWGSTKVIIPIRYKKTEELVRYLINIGMPLGNTAVFYAINGGYIDNFIQFLLAQGAETDSQDLNLAAQKRRWVLVPLLIRLLSEDDLNYRQTRSEYTTWYNSQSADYRSKYPFDYDPISSKTALMFAAEHGQFNIVKMLVENGAKVNLRADGGETATTLAYDNGEIEIYNYLKANGAIDFEPRQVTQQPVAPSRPAAPSQSTTNVYVQPSAPAQSAPTPAPRPAAPTLRPGKYACSGTNVTMEISSPLRFVSFYSGYTIVGNGSYTINGNTLVITVIQANDVIKHMLGRTYDYTITSDSSFSGQGERWVRTGN